MLKKSPSAADSALHADGFFIALTATSAYLKRKGPIMERGVVIERQFNPGIAIAHARQLY